MSVSVGAISVIWTHKRKSPTGSKNRTREWVEQLNYERIEFPVATKHYGKIEEQNSININVFGCENKQFYPIYVSKECNEDVLNQLLITKDEKKHHVLIKDFNSFMYNKTKHEHRKFFACIAYNVLVVKRYLPNKRPTAWLLTASRLLGCHKKSNNILQFQNFHKQMPEPFVIYADFEAITEKIQGCQPNNTQSYTESYQKHTGCSYWYKVVCCCDDKYTE